MNLALVLNTLIAWSAQVFVLVAAAACIAITIAHPKGRLLFWQGVLLLAVVIPIVEPWKPAAPILVIPPTYGYGIIIGAAAAPAPSPQIPWRREDSLLIIAIGAALRLIWIAAGFARLRAYRIRARRLTDLPLPFVSDAARWYASEDVPGPVTYGWLRPSILLPSRVLALPAALREPIACHELLHVNRGDWLFVLAEEFLRSALWFHPAIWFVLSRIQIAREQVVDREVVQLTGNRDGYLDALVAVAEQSLHADLAPAPLFLRKRQLNVRVKEVLKEVSMSRTHLAARLTGGFAVALAAARVAVWFFPFVSQAQTFGDAPGVTVTPGAPLIHRAPVRTPPGSSAGTVIVDATLDSKGEVTDTRVVSGPVELRRTAIESVLQWHYSPGPAQAQASITFPAAPQGPAARAEFTAPPPPPPPPPGGNFRALANDTPGTLKSVEFIGIGPDAERELRSRVTIPLGTVVMRADLMRITEAVQAYDSHLTARMTINTSNEWTVQVMPLAQAMPPAPPPPPVGVVGGPQKIGGPVMMAKLISRVDPQYSEEARQAKFQGTVVISAIIDENGVPGNLAVVKPLGLGLDENALAAVSQWRFSPTRLNNVPVPVQTQIEVNFRLQ
jgi:TonB family protein